MKFVKKKYEQTETFKTDCSTYKRHSIICHGKSDVKNDNAKSNLDSTREQNL